MVAGEITLVQKLPMLPNNEAGESAKEPTAEELMMKFQAPIKLEFRIKKSSAPLTKEASAPTVPPTENPTTEVLAEKEEAEGNDNVKDFKKRKDARGQNRDSKRHKGYETVRSVRCLSQTNMVLKDHILNSEQ